MIEIFEIWLQHAVCFSYTPMRIMLSSFFLPEVVLSLQKADLKFVLSVASLVRNIKNAVKIHEDISQSSVNPAELLFGRFMGIEVTAFSSLSEFYSFTWQSVKLFYCLDK